MPEGGNINPDLEAARCNAAAAELDQQAAALRKHGIVVAEEYEARAANFRARAEHVLRCEREAWAAKGKEMRGDPG